MAPSSSHLSDANRRRWPKKRHSSHEMGAGIVVDEGVSGILRRRRYAVHHREQRYSNEALLRDLLGIPLARRLT